MAPYQLQVNGRTATAESWDPAQPLVHSAPAKSPRHPWLQPSQTRSSTPPE
jgi:hypothetical protein